MPLAHCKSATPAPSSSQILLHARAKHLYFSLLGERGAAEGEIDELSHHSALTFLTGVLDEAASLDVEFPNDLRALPAWLAREHAKTARLYRNYLDERRAGESRRYFDNRSHALHFIRSVAPTKLVDGAWLYGVLPHWQDARLAPLIRIYLEELGDGVADQHHVLLYRQLLARYGCECWQDLPEAYFTQGAIQLALAHHAAHFLPEVIGFNLGYEQLPLHLPISAFELNELGIDPYYFALHVTIDNASTGHARRSLQCVLDCEPRVGDAAEFHRRVANGYKLNFVGMGTTEAIASFDLDNELLTMFDDKAAVGALLHSDYCRVGGRTVSEWLATPGQVPQFLAALQAAGWIVRGSPPQHSRFWRLLTDAQAPMFGVFDSYEQQLIADWIQVEVAPPAARAQAVNRFRQRPGRSDGGGAPALPQSASVMQTIAYHLHGDDTSATAVALLRKRLVGASGKPQVLAALRGLLSPANHPTPAGVLATRLYADLLHR